MPLLTSNVMFNKAKNHICPKCKTGIGYLRVLTWGPGKSYACPNCQTPLTVSATSNRVLIYGGLTVILPSCYYYLATQSTLSAAVVVSAFVTVLLVTALAQRIVCART